MLTINGVVNDIYDDTKIIFCKTDFLLSDFYNISTLEHDVVFITGNSDYSITESIMEIMPSNIKVWYAQNLMVKNDKLKPFPIGLENKIVCIRNNHGVAYPERASEKENIILNLSERIPEKFIYANFNINTNPRYRNFVKQHISNVSHIDWETPVFSLEYFFNKIKEYKMVLCPVGNGIDTHRLWEVLYCNRIPITIKVGNYPIYDLYEELPIIILEDINEIKDKEYIEQKYDLIKNKCYNKQILTIDYWQRLIKEHL